MPGRNLPRKSRRHAQAEHVKSVFTGGMNGASMSAAPVRTKQAQSGAVFSGACPSIQFFNEEFPAAGSGSQILTLKYLPIPHSEHVYLCKGAYGTYRREGVAWSRDPGSVRMIVLPGMGAAYGDTIVVEYACYETTTESVVAGCGSFPTYLPDANGSLNYQLGPPHPPNTKFLCNSQYLQFTVNGDGTGALGNGGSGPGLKYDPSGTGSFAGILEDFIDPGSPWEEYSFTTINVANHTIANQISGSNEGGYGGGLAEIWEVAPNYHYVTKIGDPSMGWIVCQYVVSGNVICMSMLYLNATNVTQYVQAMRGVDPDQDAYSVDPNSTDHDTYNYIGYGGKSSDTNATGIGGTGLVMELDAMPSPYRTVAHVCADWSVNDTIHLLASPSVDHFYADDGIVVAWDIGYVGPGEHVEVQCSYTMRQIPPPGLP